MAGHKEVEVVCQELQLKSKIRMSCHDVKCKELFILKEKRLLKLLTDN